MKLALNQQKSLGQNDEAVVQSYQKDPSQHGSLGLLGGHWPDIILLMFISLHLQKLLSLEVI